jgi:hypothetical protein
MAALRIGARAPGHPEGRIRRRRRLRDAGRRLRQGRSDEPLVANCHHCARTNPQCNYPEGTKDATPFVALLNPLTRFIQIFSPLHGSSP